MNILVVDIRMLTPDNDAASWRMYHILGVLRELSCRVTFAASFPSSWPPHSGRLPDDAARLRELGVEVLTDTLHKSVEEDLREKGALYDIVILSTEHVATKHLASVRTHAPQAVVVYDTMDLHYRRYYREAKVTGKVKAIQRALETKKRELTAASRADWTLTVNPLEKEVLEKECPGARVHVVSIPFAPHGSAKSFGERQGILFVGSFENIGNLDAALFFIYEVLPSIREKIPGIPVCVIGYVPPDLLKEYDFHDVLLAGWVPDLAPYFAGCRLSIAPLRFGAGVKGKVLTSLSYGVPVVATSVAAEGMPLTPGQDILMADSPEDFGRAVVSLHEDEQLWRTLSLNGLAALSRYFSPDAVRVQLSDLLLKIEKRGSHG